MKRVFVSVQLILFGAIFLVPMVWAAFEVVSGEETYTTADPYFVAPYATMPPTFPAPTPMTTPMVDDYVLFQGERLEGEADRLSLDLTREAAQAEADRISGIIYATDTQRALELARVAQQQELERQDTANELLRLRLKEEEGMVTRNAEQAAINMQLAAEETRVANQAAGVVQLAQAQATATAIAAESVMMEAAAVKSAGLSILTLAAVSVVFIALVVTGGIKAAPHAVAIYKANVGAQSRVTISPAPVAHIAPTTTETVQALPPPTTPPIRVRPVIDPSMTVNDSVTPRGAAFLDPTAQSFTEEEKDRIVEAYGIHKWVSPATAAVFGSCNSRRKAKVEAVLIERGIIQPQTVAA